MAFQWFQSPGACTLIFQGPPSKRREDVDVMITSNSLRAGIKGYAPACDGGLAGQVKPNTLRWGFKTTAQNTVNVVMHFEKQQKGAMWPSLFSSGSPSLQIPETKRVRITYGYDATDPFELTVRENDILTVVAEDPSGWWKGDLNGVVGIFPSNFSEPYEYQDDEFDVDDVAEATAASQLSTSSSGNKPSGGMGGIGLGAAVNSELAAKLLRRAGGPAPAPAPAAVVAAPAAAPEPAQPMWKAPSQSRQQQQVTQPPPPPQPEPEPIVEPEPEPVVEKPEPGTVIPTLVLAPGEKGYVRGTFNYDAQADGELGFHDGDIITVLTQDESGWWQGELNGVVGWFPANFTEVYTNESDVSSVEVKLTEAIQQAATTKLTRVSRATGPGRRKPNSHQVQIRTWTDTEESPGAQTAGSVAGPGIAPGTSGGASTSSNAFNPAKRMTMAPNALTGELNARLANKAAGISTAAAASAPAAGASITPRQQPAAPARAKPVTPAKPAGPGLLKPAQPRASVKPPSSQSAESGGLPFPVQLRSVQSSEAATAPAAEKPVMQPERPSPAAPERAMPTAPQKPQPAVRRSVPPPPRPKPAASQAPAPAPAPVAAAAPAAEPEPITPKGSSSIVAAAAFVQPEPEPIVAAPITTPVVQPSAEQQHHAHKASNIHTTPPDWPKTLPDFNTFCQELTALFASLSPADGAVAPDFVQAPRGTGFAVCTMDGQVFTHGTIAADGDTITAGNVMSPLLFAAATNELGADVLSKHIGKERKAIDTASPKALYPWSTAGGITLCSLQLPANDATTPGWQRLLGLLEKANVLANSQLGANLPEYFKSKSTSDATWGLAYALKTAAGCLPEGARVADLMDLFFQINSTQMTIHQAAVYAASLANDGTCVAGQQTKKTVSTKCAISMMSMCGLCSDLANKVPSVGAASGLCILSVPKVFGVAVYSPEIITHSTGEPISSVGTEFIRQISAKFRFK